MSTGASKARRVPLIAILLAVGITVLLAFRFLGREDYSSVCVKTGMLCYSRSLGPLTIHKRIEQTALSRVLVESGYRDPSQHEWVYAHGRGRDLLGLHTRFTASGAALSLHETLDSTQVASTVRLLVAHADKATVEKWLQRIFNSDVAPRIGYYFSDVEEHTNKQDFIRWLSEREEEFTQMQKAP